MVPPKANILLVDDQPGNLLVLEAVLEGLGQNLVKASSAAQALRCLLHDDFALILMDAQMPVMDGFEAAALIRQREKTRLHADYLHHGLRAHRRPGVQGVLRRRGGFSVQARHPGSPSLQSLGLR